MRTIVHFTAMPLAYPLHPSSQLGTLHSFVERHFAPHIAVRSHHAFLPILHRAFGLEMTRFFARYSLVGEEILYLCCAYSAARHGETEFLPAMTFDEAYDRYHTYSASAENDSQQYLVPISRDEIALLSDAIEHFVESELLPSLNPDALNIIGYTASFCQVFGSVFAARHLNRLIAKKECKPRVVNIFGGSSFTLPEGRRTLSAWDIDGLIVKGTGEAPLKRILTAALDIPKATVNAKLLGLLAKAGGSNVSTILDPDHGISLSHSQQLMEGLPDPNYDDYFKALRGLCDNEQAFKVVCRDYVSLPVEGSRGCFAKCDFCHNPNITAEFRSLSGLQVAQRTIRLVERYGVQDVTFVDSVCNTWAEAYADHLIKRGMHLPAFLELRVHEGEAFWTKMAHCGANRLQLGIEAISDGLLRRMKKGTRVAQNLAATKYMCEMGIRDASNLIIHHPRSTVEDVLETIRVMRICEHFPVFNLSRFVVSYASPLYEELDEVRKAALSRGFDWLPKSMAEYGWPRHLSYTWPNAWSESAVVDAWTDFQAWYESHCRDLEIRERRPALDVVEETAKRVVVQDTRYGENRLIALAGLDRMVFDACHRPMKLWHLARETGVDEAALQAVLDQLTAAGLVIQIADDHLTVALRRKERCSYSSIAGEARLKIEDEQRTAALHTAMQPEGMM